LKEELEVTEVIDQPIEEAEIGPDSAELDASAGPEVDPSIAASAEGAENE
jgi:hypothetical protein